MAIWQVDFKILNTRNNINCEIFEKSLQKISQYFPEKQSWCKTLRQFGNTESTCIEIDTTGEDPISLRIDLRNISNIQLVAICEFIKTNDFNLVRDDLIYEPTSKAFLDAFSNSPAKKFLQNPQKFLKEESPRDDSSVPAKYNTVDGSLSSD